ncbi:MAG: DUF5777 family beta-barrel protein [bacterium]
MFFNNFIKIFCLLLIVTQGIYGQQWQRNTEKLEPELLNIFHSTQAINLPTAETLQKGDFEFEISHRFIPSIKSGSKGLWGFDGPVNIRFGLGYALTDNTLITLGRSNLEDNLDLSIKYRVFQFNNNIFPLLFAIRGGAAWNSDVIGRNSSSSKNYQYFAQLIINAKHTKYFALGIVPSYLYNSYIYCSNNQYSFTMGINMQYYISNMWSLLLELNPTVTGWRSKHNPVSFGLELETGGHFFKIILSNSTKLNTSQFLSGSSNSFNDGNMHIGFNITRVL